MFCNLDSLHARTEAHCGISLGQAAGHTAGDAGCKRREAGGFGVVFGFRGDEEEDGTFGGGFNPGPRDEPLINCGPVRLA